MSLMSLLLLITAPVVTHVGRTGVSAIRASIKGIIIPASIVVQQSVAHGMPNNI